MNKQGNKTNPAGGIEWTHIFGPGTGYTANPVRGCQHQCRWVLADGHQPDSQRKIITCYAEAQRDRMNGPGAFQNVTFHPEVLDAIRRQATPARCGIFIDSMSDLFAQGVELEWILKTIGVMRECPQHIFFSLTKNPTRLTALQNTISLKWPANLALGVSMPPTFMFGKELTLAQQRAWFDKALACLVACNTSCRWVSLEPLSWDCSDLLAKYRDKLHWAVIGAASDGGRTFQPEPKVFSSVLNMLNGYLPIFYKGNLRPLITELGLAWHQRFPIVNRNTTSTTVG